MIILVIGWDSYGLADITEALFRRGYELDFFDYPNLKQDTRNNPQMEENLLGKLSEKRYEFVFSTNYFQAVAKACHAGKVKYVSWTYDSPYSSLYSQTISNPYNYAFIFDKAVYDDLKKRGINTVYYLPLSAPVSRYDSYIPTDEEKKSLCGEVVFVGATYMEEKHRFYEYLTGINDFSRGYIDGLVQGQKLIYGRNIMDDLLPKEVVDELMRVCPTPYYSDDMQTPEWYYSRFILSRRITGMERKEVLNLLSENHEVVLYTNEKTPYLPKVVNRGSVDAYKDVALVYKCAKINLNMTLRSIETGIPLRAMDILGCGGFLMTNYQEDFLDLFVPNEDFVYYESYEDLLQKTEYYLTHEQERRKIAENGYRKVRQFHTYTHRIDEILRIINE